MNIPLSISSKYPRATKFLREHPEFKSLDEAIEFLAKQIDGRKVECNMSV